VTADNFRWAGFLAIASALLSVPFSLLSSRLAPDHDFFTILVQITLQLAGCSIFVCLMSFLRKFLHAHLSFHGADSYIEFLITIILIFNIGVILGFLLPAWKDALNSFALLLLISFGVSQMLFGIKLFTAPEIHGRMVKLFSFLSVSSGFFIATLVLLRLGILMEAAKDIVMGIMFLKSGSCIPASDDGPNPHQG